MTDADSGLTHFSHISPSPSLSLSVFHCLPKSQPFLSPSPTSLALKHKSNQNQRLCNPCLLLMIKSQGMNECVGIFYQVLFGLYKACIHSQARAASDSVTILWPLYTASLDKCGETKYIIQLLHLTQSCLMYISLTTGENHAAKDHQLFQHHTVPLMSSGVQESVSSEYPVWQHL